MNAASGSWGISPVLLLGSAAELRRRLFVVKQMKHGQQRVLKRHARPSVAHDLTDRLALGGLKAVDHAVDAGGFVDAEPTVFDPRLAVIKQRLAGWTEIRAGIPRSIGMLIATEQRKHRPNGLLFAADPS